MRSDRRAGAWRRPLAGAALLAAATLAPLLVQAKDRAAGDAAAATAAAVEPAFAPRACPAGLDAVATCHLAQHASGAFLLVAMPRDWNRGLVVHAHGGPRMGTPEAGDGDEDLERYAAMVRAGYAWIGSTYRRGGYGVRSAAADVEDSRRAFLARWERPRRIVLHGQSWGGNVAAKVAELSALDVDGSRNYDAVLTTNGVLTGGTGAYGFRADLRAVYQFYCGNHPAKDEQQYPLWQGLPADSTLDRAELAKRVDACTGVGHAAVERTPEQAATLADILAVTGVAEKQLVAHLAWATFTFRDLVQLRLGGRNPFDNMATQYTGSRDDAALNAGVQRFAADPAAVALLAYDADLSGDIVLPTLAIHAAHDPVVSPKALAAYRDIVDGAGRGALLATVATDERDHSRLRDGTYLAALRALEIWLDGGPRPDAASLDTACTAAVRDAAACGHFLAPERMNPAAPAAGAMPRRDRGGAR